MTARDPEREMSPGDLGSAGAMALELHGARIDRRVTEPSSPHEVASPQTRAAHPRAGDGADRPASPADAGGLAPLSAVDSAPAEAREVATGWEAVYRDHVVAVHRFAASRTGNIPDAEDVTAQVFLRALPRIRLTAAPGEVRSYLLTTARTVLAEHWSARFGAPLEPLDEGRDQGAHPGAAPSDDVPGDRGAGRVAAILGRLPDNYRRVLELRFLDGCSVRETAERLGVSVANAKVLQFRALRRAQQLEGDMP